MEILSFITIIAYILVSSLKVSMAVKTIPRSLFISDGTTLVSKGGSFELGFFTPGNSRKRYRGLWYKNIPIQTAVWVANRVNPINDSSAATLTINSTGSLVLTQNDSVIWYSSSLKQVPNPVAELLDSGNLVVRDEEEANPETYLWQSFDYPSDTHLPGMKLGSDLRSGLNRRLTAWMSPDNPSPGELSLTIALRRYPEIYMMKGDSKYFRTGPWYGMGFSGSSHLQQNYVADNKFVYAKNEVYYTYSQKSDSKILRYLVNQTDYARYYYVWMQTEYKWKIKGSKPRFDCDHYGLCGAIANCIINETPVCQCLKGFTPKSPQNWNPVNWSDVCIRSKPLNCSEKHKDAFIKVEGLIVPKTTHTWVDETINGKQCREKYLDDCSCMAYTNSDVRWADSGCVLWFGDLIDIRQFSVGGQDLYIRLGASELEYGSSKKLTVLVATSIATAISGILIVGSVITIVNSAKL